MFLKLKAIVNLLIRQNLFSIKKINLCCLLLILFKNYTNARNTIIRNIHNKEKDQRLEKLYIQFSEIYKLQYNLNNPISIKNNKLNQMRPEVFYFTNELAKWILTSRQKQIAEKKYELQLIIKCIRINNISDFIINSSNSIRLIIQNEQSSYFRGQAYFKPPELVERIINLTCMFIEPKFKFYNIIGVNAKKSYVEKIFKINSKFRCKLYK
ncbi:unnamed protein product [Paramecium primaurelia]|uniref:Uncharacterized protein n=1 Tax=Paramecium primaurelia TaxID=5886 RepID=A0A8S1NNW8_PARPR|nr:unnamed protein product [Paramecium primaurelia]